VDRSAVRRRRGDAIAGVAGLLLFAACALGARSGSVGGAERRVFEAINGLPDALEPAAFGAQFLGTLAIGPLVALVALLLRRPRLAIAALLVTILKLVSERIVWRMVERSRPGVTEPEVIVRAGTPMTGASFVSGHVVLLTGLATVVTPYLRGRWRLTPWIGVTVIGFARIYLGAHNPLDVAGGLGLGLAIGSLVNLLLGVPAGTRTSVGPGASAPGPAAPGAEPA
jgi:undecaprenyl-diphosphatase